MFRNFFVLFSAFLFVFSCKSYAENNQINTSKNESIKWENYYQNTLNITDPHKTLLLAYKYFQMENTLEGKAADLGAGTGRDTLFLLNSGWQVFALDAEQLSIDIILNRIEPNQILNLEVLVSPFSKMALPKELHLINASYSLPFCKPEDFDQCWNTIVSSLMAGGRFCGHFFGKHDEWANNPSLTIHSYEDLIALFQDQFVIEYLQIEDGLVPCANGKMKHWHTYHVIAKKIN